MKESVCNNAFGGDDHNANSEPDRDNREQDELIVSRDSNLVRRGN